MTTHVKLLCGLTAIFIAGVVVGGSFGFRIGKSSVPTTIPEPPRRAGNSSGGGSAAPAVFSPERMCSKLQRDLNLTEEQLAQIKPIFEQTGAQLKAVNAENFERVRAIFRASHQKMKPFLTPEQIQKLEDKDRERDRRFKRPEKPKC
jgi:Spy/CpxP family protein refolding chaperone